MRTNPAAESLAAERAALLTFMDKLASLRQCVDVPASALPKDLAVHRCVLNVRNGLMLVLVPRKEVTSIFQISGIETFTPTLIVPGDVRVPLSPAGLDKLFAAWRDVVVPA